jgi:hydroxymethylpyrimidine/phosphomethylpyrimidine kinase
LLSRLPSSQLSTGYGTSAITAITAQNTRGVDAVQGVSPDMLTAQINSLFADIPPAAIKTGMLYSTENIAAVVQALESNCRKDQHPPSKNPVAFRPKVGNAR